MSWFFSVLPNAKQGLTLQELYTFPWEKEAEKEFNKKMTAEETKNFFAGWDNLKPLE